MSAPPNYVFTIFALVAFFLCLIKFPVQSHAWNVGTQLFLAWVGLECLFLGINSIIWNHNIVNWAPVWCDITSRFNFGISTAAPAALLCINRRLYLLASPTSILPSQGERRREFMIDLVIGLGLPIMEMILLFFAQNARYVIVEGYGCSSSLLGTWVAVVIVSVPPILLELIAGVYSCLSIRALYKRRSEVVESLSGHQNLNSNRYIRLMFFSFCDLLVVIPITVLFLYLNTRTALFPFTRKTLLPFPGLTREHHHLSRVVRVPAAVWRASTLLELAVELNRWMVVWGAFVFFAIFGFTRESRNNYRAFLRSVVQAFMTMIGIKTRPSSEPEGITFKAATRELDTVDSNLVV